MGWSSGTELAQVIQDTIVIYMPKNAWERSVKKILDSLEDADWDCQDEVDLFYYFGQLKVMVESNFKGEDYEDYDNEDKEHCTEQYNEIKEKYGL